MVSSTRSPEIDVDRLRSTVLRIARELRSTLGGDITPSQFAVIASLARHGTSTMGEIATRERVQPPSVTRLVGSLVQLGLVERREDPDDRRCVRVSLSSDGKRYLTDYRSSSVAWLAARVERLTEDEVDALRAGTSVLERLLEDLG